MSSRAVAASIEEGLRSMYQGYGNDSRPKVRVAVEISSDETTITGHIFLNPSERIIDMMNDARQYVAFEHVDGTFEVLSKVLIRRIRPVDQLSITHIWSDLELSDTRTCVG